MQVAIDGLIFETQPRGGVLRIYQTILPLMCELDPQLDISLYLARRPKEPQPSHPQIHTKRLLPLEFRGLAWTGLNISQRRSIALSLAVRAQQETIWHSTFFSHPLRWAGPTVVSVYDFIIFRYQHLFADPFHTSLRQHMTQAIQTADVVLCISATTAHDAVELLGIDPNKTKVVPLAASPTFHPLAKAESNEPAKQGFPKGFSTDKPFLLYVGTRTNYKNFPTLLNAYARWPHHADVDLVVVGRAWEPNEVAEITEYQITDNIHLCPEVNDEELNHLYNHALAFVYPSLYEGFGIPLLEAMAVGCPIIASDIPSNREIARDYPTYFNATDIDSLVAAMDVTWQNKAEPTHIAYGQQIAAQYTWQQTARLTLQQYYAASNKALPPRLA